MLFVSYLLVFLVIQFSDAKLVAEGNCRNIDFRRLFSSPPSINATKGYGHIYDDPTQTIPNHAVGLFPYYKPGFNSSASLLIYKKKDSQFITNIPKDVSNVESWDDSFGICTQEDIDLGKCDKIGEFKLELKDESIKERILNNIYHFDQSQNGHLMGFFIELEIGSFCYITAFEDYADNQDSGENEPENIVLLIVHDNEAENTRKYIEYYGHMILSIIHFFLGIFILLTIKSDRKKNNNNNRSTISTPHKCCLTIIIISLLRSSLHMFYNRANFVFHTQSNIFGQRSPPDSLIFTIIRISVPVLETLGDILIYLLCFQFVNLDNLGLKINLGKNKFGYLFIGGLFWTLTVYPFIMDYGYILLFTIRKYLDEEKSAYIIKILNFIVYILCFRGFDLLNYIIIWFILYRTSQETENKFLSNNNKLKEYKHRFKLMRIWLVFSAIVLKFIEFIFRRLIYKIIRKLFEYVVSKMDESPSTGGLEVIFSSIILFLLKGVLCILRTFEIFSLPILIIITLGIWWNYDEVKFEEVEMENLLN